MGDNTAATAGQKSIKNTESDRETAEDLGVADTSVSSLYSEALKEWRILEQKRSQATQLKREMREGGRVTLSDVWQFVEGFDEPRK